MQGCQERSSSLFSYDSIEEPIPTSHPLSGFASWRIRIPPTYSRLYTLEGLQSVSRSS